MVGAQLLFVLLPEKEEERQCCVKRKTNDNCLISLNVTAFPGLEDLASKGASGILVAQGRRFPASSRNRNNRERKTWRLCVL